MFTAAYFPLVSALAVRCLPDGFLDKLCDGNFSAARTQASRWLEDGHRGAELPWLLQLRADLEMVSGIGDDLEEQYRRAQKAIRTPRHAIRVASCRNAGWQAFFRHRLTTSFSCFTRVIDEKDVDPFQQFEARFGIICTLHQLGRSGDASDALGELSQLVESISDRGVDHWRDLIATMRFDLAVQRELLACAPLVDHVYWRSGMSDARAAGAADSADLCEAQAARVETPLLRQRIGYLRHLRELAGGSRTAMEGVIAHLNWAQRVGLHEYAYTTRLEVVLAALALEAPQLTEMLLEPLHRVDYAGATGRRQLEYLYCVAKLRQAQGRTRESMQFYSRYALITTQCLRDDASAIAPFANRAVRSAPQLDDVGARLPAKYRRAYRYLQENLDRHDLSVREVAAEVGVTERALQSAFKNFLGLSPTELIRRQRMERIRAELLNDPAVSDRNVLNAANKWGVHNRSTLVSGYRRQFQEAPSETLER
jgi:AraC-like DNA-binding protein